MSAADRWAAVKGQPEPTPTAQLTRVQLLARITVLREIEDLLILQAHTDGGESFRCRGSVKIELRSLEADLFRRDQLAEQGEPIPQAVALAMVGRQS